MSNKLYDILKWVAMLFLPAMATFVSGLFLVWNIPYGEEISKTIMLIDAFLGACLGVSNIKYNATNKKTDDLEFIDMNDDVPEE